MRRVVVGADRANTASGSPDADVVLTTVTVNAGLRNARCVQLTPDLVRDAEKHRERHRSGSGGRGSRPAASQQSAAWSRNQKSHEGDTSGKVRLLVGICGKTGLRVLRRTSRAGGRSGAAAHPIHQASGGDSVFEERFTVALGVDGIRKVAEHILDLLLGMTGSPKDALGFGVRNEALVLHQLDATRRQPSLTLDNRQIRTKAWGAKDGRPRGEILAAVGTFDGRPWGGSHRRRHRIQPRSRTSRRQSSHPAQQRDTVRGVAQRPKSAIGSSIISHGISKRE